MLRLDHLHDQALCARRAKVIEDHPHNGDDSVLMERMLMR
jgi:hypothetical protein